MRKFIDVVRVDGLGADDDATRALVDVAGAALLADASLAGLQLDIARPGGSTRFSRRIWPELSAPRAVVSRWYGDAVATPPPLPRDAGVQTVWTFEVVEHVGIERTRDWPEGAPTPGMKHLSLLCGTVPADEFRVAYRHHVELVLEHLPLMWRYVQNDIDAGYGARATEFAALSELSYRNDDEYERRWKHGAAGEAQFQSHEGFLDLPKTVTMICTEHILRSPTNNG